MKDKEEMSPQEKKMEMLKKHYKSLPLPKVRDIQAQLKRKSKRYQDLGAKVPKDVTSLQRTLTYIIRAKEAEAIEKGAVKESIDYGVLKDLITSRIKVKPLKKVKQSIFPNAIDVWKLSENIYLKTTDDNNLVLFSMSADDNLKFKYKELKKIGGDEDLSNFLRLAKRKKV